MSQENNFGKKCIKIYALSLYFNLDGKYKFCRYQPSKGYRDFVDLDTLKKSSLLQDIRKNMEEGGEHNMCSHCYNYERKGLKSPRISFNEGYISKNNYFPQKYSEFPKELFLRFNNICNLSCRMCSSYASTGKIKLDILLFGKAHKLRTIPQKTIEYIYDRNLLSRVEEIDIKGGEPLLLRENFQYLDFLISQKLAHNIKLTYNTNLMVLPSKENRFSYLLPGKYTNIFEMFDKFKGIKLRVSIDAYGEDNKYIRIGSNWDVILRNLYIIKKYKNIELVMTSTIQIDNLFLIPKLIIFSEKIGIKLNLFTHNIVTHPIHYNIQILPIGIKRRVKYFYKIFLDNHNIPDIYRKNIDDIIQYMDKGETDISELYEYVRVTNITDIDIGGTHKNKILQLIKEELISL